MLCVIRMRVKTTMKCTVTTSMVHMRRLMMASVGRCQHPQLSDVAGGREWSLFKVSKFGSSYKVRHMLTTYPAGPLLGIFSWEMKSYVHTRLEPQCPVDLFIVASNRPSLSAGEWMNTLGQSYGEMLIAAKGAKGSSCRMYNSQKHVKWKVKHKGNI